ncbi:MAG: 2-C-methyl-D-erythritol 2,4-cyclodiphosphate synthase [Fibromonadaceae bacterium]|jgi:2-C-methyl-D-erythritol 2,4-cyclodiphosphate synthase|nr:2-C-methyl-D-erythritol 2,4-cyclodiphosphate synthase [Fibromonadaceae bacterium]
MFKIGMGFDVHRLVEGRKCIVGGVEIPHSKGLLGHSDADVLTHAICDAVLGAAGLGDIGTHFPDNDPKFKDIDSLILLKQVKEEIFKLGFKIENIDSIIMAEKPKMNPHRSEMKAALAKTLGIEEAKIGIKATTTEKLGFVGREEGIAAQAVALISYIQNHE